VVIKKGEHGAMLASEAGLFLVPAYPVEKVVDPTGAGDSFAGAFMGFLAKGNNLADSRVREGLLNGAVVASFGVEDFSLDRLESLTTQAIGERMDELQGMMRLEGCL
jgi:sugar/nucleoside kinase (ribokinase family)